MSSHNEELIYSQGDMEGVLAQLRDANKEAEQSKQLLWAVVQATGGEVEVPYTAWLTGDPTKELIMWDDTETFRLHLKIKNLTGDDDGTDDLSTRRSR
jgi:hypothetical protein